MRFFQPDQLSNYHLDLFLIRHLMLMHFSLFRSHHRSHHDFNVQCRQGKRVYLLCSLFENPTSDNREFPCNVWSSSQLQEPPEQHKNLETEPIVIQLKMKLANGHQKPTFLNFWREFPHHLWGIPVMACFFNVVSPWGLIQGSLIWQLRNLPRLLKQPGPAKRW